MITIITDNKNPVDIDIAALDLIFFDNSVVPNIPITIQVVKNKTIYGMDKFSIFFDENIFVPNADITKVFLASIVIVFS